MSASMTRAESTARSSQAKTQAVRIPSKPTSVEIVEKGLAILGSYISNFTFPAAIRLIEGGRLNVAPMISAIVGLEDTAAGIARLRSGEAVKIVVTP